MLINGKVWEGITVHFASKDILSFIGSLDPASTKEVVRYKLEKGIYIHLPDTKKINYIEIDIFAGATSLDDPLVKEWEKEHAYKERP